MPVRPVVNALGEGPVGRTPCWQYALLEMHQVGGLSAVCLAGSMPYQQYAQLETRQAVVLILQFDLGRLMFW